MGLALILFAGAVVILIWLYLWSLQRQRLGHIPELETSMTDIPAAAMVANGDAVIVATEHGQVIHVNETIRHWLNVENPDLEMIARSAQPVDTFLELFTREAQASLQMGQALGRSDLAPRPDGWRAADGRRPARTDRQHHQSRCA